MNQKPLGWRIDHAIEHSDLLEDDKKLLALEDLRQMYADGEYGEKCLLGQPGSTIAAHHLWSFSKLGHKFWEKMDLIIESV